MTAVMVEFHDVGRDKRSWTAALREFSQDELHAEVKRKGALRSGDIDFHYDEAANSGVVIVGGCRAVGAFKVVADGAQ
jgi:hypothetical protein